MMLFWRKKKEQPPTQSGLPLVAIVDDDEDLCTLLRIALVTEGYDVAEAHDGEAGLALIRERRPSVVLLDIKMPKMNGYQVLARLQQDPELASTPVFVMTSVVADEHGTSDEEWARKLEVDHFFSKPLEIEALVARIKDQLGQPVADPPQPADEFRD